MKRDRRLKLRKQKNEDEYQKIMDMPQEQQDKYLEKRQTRRLTMKFQEQVYMRAAVIKGKIDLWTATEA